MNAPAPKSIDPRRACVGLSKLLLLIFEDGTDVTFADLEDATEAIESLAAHIEMLKRGIGVPDAVGSSLRLQE